MRCSRENWKGGSLPIIGVAMARLHQGQPSWASRGARCLLKRLSDSVMLGADCLHGGRAVGETWWVTITRFYSDLALLSLLSVHS